MKRGNDDEKIMGPMFPRLHVNDTDKGGPRAPPRNKMALYEQLSVPSQRYNSIGSVSTNPNNNNNNNNNDLVSSTSASQGIVRERNMGFPFYQQPIPPSYDARHPETASLTNETTSAEKRKKPSEEDDFMVPSFSQPGVGQCKTQKNTDGERHNHQSCEGNIAAVAENKHGEGASYMPSEVAPKDVHEVDEGMLRGRDDHLLERDNADKGNNDASDTSMVDSVSGVDISPDDIVGVIGRKHFWKARTAIVNQQRVFAIQVFELHRLMKVQKLIAGSPHLLLEGSAFMGKNSMNNSPIKKYSSDYGVKPQAQVHTVKHKDNHQKPADKLEGTAENAVTKVSTQSQNVPQPTGYPSFSASGPMPMPMPMPMPVPLPPVNGADPKTNQWGFQQWLVPVMTPSEGLVYKLYPAPGMVGPMYGCGGPSPEMGNMMNIPYMLPNPNYHPVPPGGQFGGQGCFPTYAMPPMNTSISGSGVGQNQMNQFPQPNQYRCPTSQPNGNTGSQHQNSCNTPIQKHGSATNPLEVTLPKEGEMLGSTASSPCERARTVTRTGVGSPTTKGTDTLCLFPAGPTLEVSEEGVATDKGSRVIKVVPHNAKSTRESATRIFRSIQAERRQHESS